MNKIKEWWGRHWLLSLVIFLAIIWLGSITWLIIIGLSTPDQPKMSMAETRLSTKEAGLLFEILSDSLMLQPGSRKGKRLNLYRVGDSLQWLERPPFNPAGPRASCGWLGRSAQKIGGTEGERPRLFKRRQGETGAQGLVLCLIIPSV